MMYAKFNTLFCFGPAALEFHLEYLDVLIVILLLFRIHARH